MYAPSDITLMHGAGLTTCKMAGHKDLGYVASESTIKQRAIGINYFGTWEHLRTYNHQGSGFDLL